MGGTNVGIVLEEDSVRYGQSPAHERLGSSGRIHCGDADLARLKSSGLCGFACGAGTSGSVAGTLILWAFCAAWRDRRARNGDRSRAYGLGNLIDSLLRPRQEWWWATDDAGTILFSSSASLELLGYPSELEGHRATPSPLP